MSDAPPEEPPELMEREAEPIQDETEREAPAVSALNTRLEELEAHLIAQDHRAIPVLRTFFAERRQWDRSDPRWTASWTAFLWWCVGSLASPAGAAVGLAAFLTVALTGWNAWEFRRQNEALAEQNRTLQRQVEQQTSDALIARRAQLLDIIYKEECAKLVSPGEGQPEVRAPAPSKKCTPIAHVRARQEAGIAFIEIENGRSAEVNLDEAELQKIALTGANLWRAKLRETNLWRANLREVNLREADLLLANLYGADLREADLREADLLSANLREANLREADLREANLSRARLKDANLLEADLSGANLLFANLREADLRQARNLTQDQIADAIGFEATQLPLFLQRPAHWSLTFEEQFEHIRKVRAERQVSEASP